MDQSLLCSSDYEHIIEDLKGLDSLPPLHLSPGYVGVPATQTALEPMNTDDGNGAVVSTSPTCTIPCRENFPGPLDFNVFLDSTTADKRSWVYSHELNKVFIDMNKSLLVQFQIRQNTHGLCVRALPVYSMADYVSVPVHRCTLHELSDDPMREAHTTENPHQCFCFNFRNVRHVVRSSHPQAWYDYDSESDRHSVVVPLDTPQAGTTTSIVEYHFSCKTSCPRGMNRKPIEVVFTLETEKCEVIGRCVLPVKICSCPKRDKEKEETDAVTGENTPSSRKRRMSSASDKQENAKKHTNQNNITKINGVKEESGITAPPFDNSAVQKEYFELVIAGLRSDVADCKNVLMKKVENQTDIITNLMIKVENQEKVIKKVENQTDIITNLMIKVENQEKVINSVYQLLLRRDCPLI